MILEVDNKGAVDLINNYSVGGRTHQMETGQYYLREFKEEEVILVFSNKRIQTTCKAICWSQHLHGTLTHCPGTIIKGECQR